jgi:hypothetical protein
MAHVKKHFFESRTIIHTSVMICTLVLSIVFWGNHPLPVLADDPTMASEASTLDTTTTTNLAVEPYIRVGLVKTSGVVTVVSYTDDYRVFAGAEERGILMLGQSASLSRSHGEYVFTSPDFSFTNTVYLRLVPVHDRHATLEITSMVRHMRGKEQANFNMYRGAIEYRNNKNDVLYIINEVLLEDYVSGIAETSPNGPFEYLKAMAVAARTYAYVTASTTKHDHQDFDVVASTADQLYLGYRSEEMMPRVVEAAGATRGMMVTYGGIPVVTPYFAHSNGRTLSWQSVWGGTTHPWLVSVTTTYDAARFKKRFGHGVGMSGWDAAHRALEESVDFRALLKYYYRDVEIDQWYE